MNTFIRAQLDLGNIGESILRIFNNALANRILFADGKTYLENEASRDQAFQVIQSGQSLVLALEMQSYTFKMKIEATDEGSFITLYPIDPVKKKKGIDCEQEELDLGFYIERMIELCENFPIYELIAGKE